jgi:hypothetical protein
MGWVTSRLSGEGPAPMIDSPQGRLPVDVPPRASTCPLPVELSSPTLRTIKACNIRPSSLALAPIEASTSGRPTS